MQDNEIKPGDLVTGSAGDHSLVVAVVVDQGQLRVTSGSAHETALINTEDVSKAPWLTGSALFQRLAYSVSQQEKIVCNYKAITNRANEEHASKLERIRKYWIDAHEQGDLSRTDLDDFLDHFDMDPYQQRWTGVVTIKVSLVVDDAEDLDTARGQVQDWISESLADNAELSEVNVRTLAYDLVKDLT